LVAALGPKEERSWPQLCCCSGKTPYFVSRAGFHSLDFAGFESLMIRNRHQIGVPAADFGKQQRARAMTN